MEYIIIGILVVLIILFFYKFKQLETKTNQGTDVSELERKYQVSQSLVDNLKEETEKLERELKELRKEKEQLVSECAQKNQMIINLKDNLSTQKEEVKELQKQFKLEFENIANEIVKENTKHFSESSKENLSQILTPLKENIEKFQKSVENRTEQDTKNQATLYEKLKQLQEMNISIGKEAKNLARALKGENKKQGNWGEFILTRILESSGLRKGEEYETEVFVQTEGEQKNIRPDVIVKLPENKHLIIDSKVTLKAYEKYSSSVDEGEKAILLKEHLNAVKKHIKDLSEKNYSGAEKFNSPDFVMLFMPVEPAFILATQENPDLFNYAWAKKIVLVCPSTLLATLKTIASIWKQERQNKYAFQIADEAGKMYDKFVLFLKSMDNIESRLVQAKEAYDKAKGQLNTGSGNLMGRFEKIKKLGANASKSLENTSFTTPQIEEDGKED